MLLPEFKFPKQQDVERDLWAWNEGGEDTMHPFWAVRRMTAQQMARAKVEVAAGKPPPRFNCELVVRSISLVCVGAMEGHSLNRTRIFEVPFLTNIQEMMQGEELILEVTGRRADPKVTKRTWREALRDEQKKQKKTTFQEGRKGEILEM